MPSLLNRLFDLDRLAAELACESVQGLRLREDVQFLAVRTANGQFALGVERRCFPVFAHLLDFLTRRVAMISESRQQRMLLFVILHTSGYIQESQTSQETLPYAQNYTRCASNSLIL